MSSISIRWVRVPVPLVRLRGVSPLRALWVRGRRLVKAAAADRGPWPVASEGERVLSRL